MSTQPTFNHPDLKVQSIPDGGHPYRAGISDDGNGAPYIRFTSGFFNSIVEYDRNGDKKKARYYRHDSGEDVLFAKIEFSHGFQEEEFFNEDGKVCYLRKNNLTSGRLEEGWFRAPKGQFAARITEYGLLTNKGYPAVVLDRPNNLRRAEYWEDGFLLRVVVRDTESCQALVEQEWENGRCVRQKVVSERVNDILAEDLALPLDPRPTLEPEVEDPPGLLEPEKPDVTEPGIGAPRTFELISAEKAREMVTANEDQIQKILDEFYFKLVHFGHERSFSFPVHPGIYKRVIEIFEKAGYKVFGRTRPHVIWVSF